MRIFVFLAISSFFVPSVLWNNSAYAETTKQAQGTNRAMLRQLRDLEAKMAQMRRQYEAQIKALKSELQAIRQSIAAREQAAELEKLRQQAEEEARKEVEEKKASEEVVYRAKGLSLQALNPEISVTGDMVSFYRSQEGTRQRSDFSFRNLGLHIESYLDPYTRFKSAVAVRKDGVKLGEAYMTRYGLLEGVNVTFGKFRQQFGVVNRWHKHGLDQVDFPLALRQIFGGGGLNQTGISFDWTMPQFLGSSQELTLQVTNGENERIFSGNTLSTPSFLIHYKNYRDLSPSTYLEVGLTGLFGWKDEWEVDSGGTSITRKQTLSTRVYGLDLNFLWEPTSRMRYRNVEWRSELYLLDRDQLAPDGTGEDRLNAWGAMSYVQSRLSRRLIAGVRADYYKPDHKDYTISPLALTSGNAHQWQVGPYLTWKQSPFVHWRLEYDHLEGEGFGKPDNIIYFQLIFAAGPHKHERY